MLTLKFKDLKVGEVFEFDRSGLPVCHGLESGPWLKTSHRRYEKPGMKCHVGSIHTTVIRLPGEIAKGVMEYADGSFRCNI